MLTGCSHYIKNIFAPDETSHTCTKMLSDIKYNIWCTVVLRIVIAIRRSDLDTHYDRAPSYNFNG